MFSGPSSFAMMDATAGREVVMVEGSKDFMTMGRENPLGGTWSDILACCAECE